MRGKALLVVGLAVGYVLGARAGLYEVANVKVHPTGSITVYTGTTDAKSSATTIIPTGATFSTDGLTTVDESAVKVVPRSSPAKKKKK